MRLRATRISGIGASRSFIAVVSVAPVNTAAPVITQTESVLSVTTGTWTGTAPITYSYQWSRNGTSVSGATGSSYSIPPEDLNALFGCIVTATNAAGNASAPAATLYVGLLDVLSVQPAASFTLRRLRRDQGANLTRVRRSTDQAETNIGFATVAQTRTNLDPVPAADGDSRTSAGITRTAVGTGTEFGQSYVDIRWNGTATATVNLRYCNTILTASPNTTTNALVTPAQTYTSSMGYRLIAGTFPAVTARLTQFYRNGTALVGEANNALPTAPTTALQRSAVVGVAPATANYVQNIFQMDGANGIVVDFTMRFYAPNTELGTGNARTLLQRYVAETIAAVGNLDANALLNFVGSGSAFISNWYDQSATNLLAFSEEIDNEVWAKVNCVVTPNAATAPDGTVTADKIVPNSGAGTGRAEQARALLPLTTYTISGYFKAAEIGWIRLRSNTDNAASVWFDLVNGVVGTREPDFISASIVDVGNGWFRCIASYTTTSNTAYSFRWLPVNEDNNNFIGNGTSGNFRWGSMINVGDTVAPYQKTLGSRDDTQATPASQPMIVSAGALITENFKPTVMFDGSTNVTSVSAFSAAQFIAVHAWKGAVPFSSNYNGLTGFLGASSLTYLQPGSSTNFGTVLNVGVRVNGSTTPVAAAVLKVTSAEGTTAYTGAYSLGQGDLGGPRQWTGPISEAIYFSAATSNTERQIVERNQGSYYGIAVA